MNTLFYVLASILIVSLVSLIGALSLTIKRNFLEKILLYLVAFSAGALIGDSIIHLIPEAFSEGGNTIMIAIGIFCGIILFFLLEKILLWRHCHDLSCEEHPKRLGTMNLVGGTAHNLIDGLLIGSSFAVSVPLGVATTIAVVCHEIPHELGDFSVLLHSGFTIKSALFYNYLSSIVAVSFAVLAYYIGNSAAEFVNFMIPLTIGSFIYIAMTDLIPELHKESGWKQSIGQILSLSLGFLVMLSLLIFE